MIAGDADNCDNDHEEDHNSFHLHKKGGRGRRKRRHDFARELIRSKWLLTKWPELSVE